LALCESIARINVDVLAPQALRAVICVAIALDPKTQSKSSQR
jgi:hypothetical protein